MTDSEDISVRAFDINRALGQLLEAARNGTAADGLADSLRASLGELIELGSLLPGVADNPFGAVVKHSFFRYRACGWLHGWATYCVLAQRLSATGNVAALWELARIEQAQGQPPALLRQLSRLHRAIADGAGVASSEDPLRSVLADGVQLINLLRYVQPWRDDRPANIAHDYFIPASRDLIGQPASAPVLDREILGIWGLVNLLLDTWQLDTTAPPRVSWNERLVGLSRLIAQACGAGDLWSDLGAAADELERHLQRLDRVQHFIEFRSKALDEVALQGMATELGSADLGDGAIPARLDPLVRAAHTVAGEVLIDARVWLRYVLTLARGHDSLSAIDAGSGQLAAGSILDAELLQLPDRGSETLRSPGWLRWNQWPKDGHSTCVLDAAVDACLGWIEARSKSRARESSLAALAISPSSAPASGLLAGNVELATIVTSLSPYFSNTEAGTDAPVAHEWLLVASAQAWSPSWADLGRSERWLRSATASERDRLQADLAYLLAHAQSAIVWNERVAAFVQGSTPQGGAQVLTRVPSLALDLEQTLAAIPSLSWKRLDKDYKTALTLYQKGAAEALADAEAVHRLLDAYRAYRAALQRALGARFSAEAAHTAAEAAALRESVSELAQRAASLKVKAARLDVEGHESEVDAARARLGARRAEVAVAGAQLDALRAVVQDATQLLAHATQELKRTRTELLDMADRFEAEKRRSSLLSIINGVVSVLGLALAPFTGGASVGVAEALHKGIDIVDRISRIDWSHLGSALGQAVSIAGDVAEEFKIELPGDWKEAKKLLASAGEVLARGKAALDTAEDVAKLLQRAGALGTHDIVTFASIVANGFALSVGDDAVRLADPQGSHLPQALEAFTAPLQRLFRSGGYLLSALQSTTAAFDQLMTKHGDDLEQALAQVLDNAVAQFPDDDVLAKFGSSVATVRAEFDQAKRDLAATVHGADDATRRAFVELLCSGALLLPAAQGDRVLLLEREVVAQAQALKPRLESAAALMVEHTWKPFVASIDAARADIHRQVQSILDADTDDKDARLKDLAKNVIAAKISTATEDVKALQAQVTQAQAKLEAAQTERKIAGYMTTAASRFRDAANQRVRVAEVESTIQAKGRDLADLGLAKAQLQAKSGDADFAAETLSVQLAGEALRNAYHGAVLRELPVASILQPRVTEETDDSSIVADVLARRSRLEIAPRASLSVVAAGLNDDLPRPDAGSRPASPQAMARTLVGQLGWALFLRLATSERVHETYLGVISAMLSNRGRDQQISMLERSYADVADVVSATQTVPTHIKATFGPGNERTLDAYPEEVIWLGHGADAATRESWLRQVPAAQRESVGFGEAQALAVFRFLFTDQSITADDRRRYIVSEKVSRTAGSYLHLRFCEVVYTPIGADPEGAADLDFVIVPPAVPRAWVGERTSTPAAEFRRVPPIGDWKRIQRELSESLIEANLQASLFDSLFDWTAPQLIGALGVWTVFLAYRSGVLEPDEQEQIRTGIKIRPYFGLVTVDSNS